MDHTNAHRRVHDKRYSRSKCTMLRNKLRFRSISLLLFYFVLTFFHSGMSRTSMMTTFSNIIMRMYKTHWPSHAVHLTGSPTNIHRLCLSIQTFSAERVEILQSKRECRSKALQPYFGHSRSINNSHRTLQNAESPTVSTPQQH